MPEVAAGPTNCGTRENQNDAGGRGAIIFVPLVTKIITPYMPKTKQILTALRPRSGAKARQTASAFQTSLKNGFTAPAVWEASVFRSPHFPPRALHIAIATRVHLCLVQLEHLKVRQLKLTRWPVSRYIRVVYGTTALTFRLTSSSICSFLPVCWRLHHCMKAPESCVRRKCRN